MGRKLFRVTPGLPAAMMRTYQIFAHTGVVTCAEVGCLAQARGWRTAVDERTELGASQAHFIRRESRRGFIEQRAPGGLTVFTFTPGQTCFETHRAKLDRPEIFRVHGGDWRGNPRGIPTVTHKRAADWVDDFANNQDRLSTLADRG